MSKIIREKINIQKVPSFKAMGMIVKKVKKWKFC